MSQLSYSSLNLVGLSFHVLVWALILSPFMDLIINRCVELLNQVLSVLAICSFYIGAISSLTTCNLGLSYEFFFWDRAAP